MKQARLPGPMAPLRILCVHGYRQNGNSFREKTGALRKLLKKHVELVYLSAPLSVRQASNTEGRTTLTAVTPAALREKLGRAISASQSCVRLKPPHTVKRGNGFVVHSVTPRKLLNQYLSQLFATSLRNLTRGPGGGPCRFPFCFLFVWIRIRYTDSGQFI